MNHNHASIYAVWGRANFIVHFSCHIYISSILLSKTFEIRFVYDYFFIFLADLSSLFINRGILYLYQHHTGNGMSTFFFFHNLWCLEELYVSLFRIICRFLSSMPRTTSLDCYSSFLFFFHFLSGGIGWIDYLFSVTEGYCQWQMLHTYSHPCTHTYTSPMIVNVADLII